MTGSVSHVVSALIRFFANAILIAGTAAGADSPNSSDPSGLCRRRQIFHVPAVGPDGRRERILGLQTCRSECTLQLSWALASPITSDCSVTLSISGVGHQEDASAHGDLAVRDVVAQLGQGAVHLVSLWLGGARVMQHSYVFKCKSEDECQALRVDIQKFWLPITRLVRPTVAQARARIARHRSSAAPQDWTTDLAHVPGDDVNAAVLWWNASNQPVVHYTFDQVPAPLLRRHGSCAKKSTIDGNVKFCCPCDPSRKFFVWQPSRAAAAECSADGDVQVHQAHQHRCWRRADQGERVPLDACSSQRSCWPRSSTWAMWI